VKESVRHANYRMWSDGQNQEEDVGAIAGRHHRRIITNRTETMEQTGLTRNVRKRRRRRSG
jgi:hypothetical protein